MSSRIGPRWFGQSSSGRSHVQERSRAFCSIREREAGFSETERTEGSRSSEATRGGGSARAWAHTQGSRLRAYPELSLELSPELSLELSKCAPWLTPLVGTQAAGTFNLGELHMA